jgi:acetoin utilization deacetylase AcuC-like enzyme
MPMGYCYLNNIAISANYLLSKGAKNILIVDFDVHHGNGTQDIFYESNHVTVVNLHHQVKDFYPRITGFENEIGSGVGEGFNYNVPLPHLCNEAEYLNALEKILNKLSQNQYDIILVSAGYDGHKADPKQAMLLDEKSFAEITSRLIQFAKSNSHNKIVFFLEGGYNRQATANSVLETAKVLKAA